MSYVFVRILENIFFKSFDSFSSVIGRPLGDSCNRFVACATEYSVCQNGICSCAAGYQRMGNFCGNTIQIFVESTCFVNSCQLTATKSRVMLSVLRQLEPTGQLYGPCFPDGSCADGSLTCLSGTCVCAPAFFEQNMECRKT